MRFEKHEFIKSDVILDGNEYLECDFKSCTFVYSGTDTFTLSQNLISSDCRFRFTGAAGDTLQVLKAIYAMGDWGKRQVVATFEEIAPGLTRH